MTATGVAVWLATEANRDGGPRTVVSTGQAEHGAPANVDKSVRDSPDLK